MKELQEAMHELDKNTAYNGYYVAVYVNDNQYSSIMDSNSYSINVSLSELRSDLVFNPLDWGTFVYDNDPEFLTNDDMADYNLGNRLLMSADGLSGVVDFQSSHSIKPYMLEEGNVSLDILLYNPTNEPITVVVDRIGYQAPYENNLSYGITDWTTTNGACLQAWVDYMQFNLESNMFIGDLKSNYLNYNFKYIHNKLPNKGVYVIEPQTAVWMLGEEACLTVTKQQWSPFNILARLNVLNGTVNLGFAAFRNRTNVYSPKSAKLIYDVNTQRSYPAEYAICSHECDCLCTCDCGARYEKDCQCPTDENRCPCRDNSCIHTCVKEHDLNGKPKGVATSVGETETKTAWIISETTEYFQPTLYNYSNPNGYKLNGTSNDYWATNFNPNADIYGGANIGVESDIIPLYFDDKDDTGNVTQSWVFDNRHTNPLSGNNLISGTAPIANAMPLGNYGVVERYTIDITNTTNIKKTITYTMQTGSHAIIMYKAGNSKWNRKLKLGELKGKYESNADYQERIIKDIFSFEMEPNETKTLIMEVILLNADAGGFRHQLGVK